MDSQEAGILSDCHRKLLNEFQSIIGSSSDEVDTFKHRIMTKEYAAGYIESFLKYASDDKIIMVYFLISSLYSTDRFNQ